MTTPTATIPVTYRRTKSGEWVAFGPVDAFKVRVQTPEGWDTADADQVTVIKKSGESKVERIAHLGKPFSVGGQQMVYAYLVPSDRGQRPAHRSHLGTCEECGDRRAVTTALDSSGLTGAVCGMCSRMSRYQRSFA